MSRNRKQQERELTSLAAEWLSIVKGMPRSPANVEEMNRMVDSMTRIAKGSAFRSMSDAEVVEARAHLEARLPAMREQADLLQRMEEHLGIQRPGS